MSEKQIPSLEKTDIVAPDLLAGGTAIVLQRHERYERAIDAEHAGSIYEDSAEDARERDLDFFRKVIAHDEVGKTMFYFASSDTQYAEKGRRSLETAQIAFDAAKIALEEAGIDPKERIINLSDEYSTTRFDATDQDIRPIKGLREPQIFEVPEYVDHLRDKYGKEDGPGAGISARAWGAHEEDAEKEVREQLGAEGVYDMLDRTKHSIRVLERYSKLFHAAHPDSRLVIWAVTHYDTLSPLVKDATGTSFGEYVPVDYGAGVVIDIPPHGRPELTTSTERVVIDLSKTALRQTIGIQDK